MDKKGTNLESMYHIRIQGTFDYSFTDWLGKIAVVPQENNSTLLIGGFADQAALRGFLDQLWNLNFTVLYLERMENEYNE